MEATKWVTDWNEDQDGYDYDVELDVDSCKMEPAHKEHSSIGITLLDMGGSGERLHINMNPLEAKALIDLLKQELEHLGAPWETD